MIELIDLKWLAIPNSFHCFYDILSKNRDLAYFVIKWLHTKSWSFGTNLKIRVMYRLPKGNMITDKLTSFWDQLQVTIIVMSIAFFPQTHSVHFLSTSTVYIYSCVQWILYMPFVQKSSTHSYPHTLPTPTPHTRHAPTNLTPSDLHTQLINTFTDAPPPHTHTESPPLHHLPSAQNGYLENVFFFCFVFCFCFFFFENSLSPCI